MTSNDLSATALIFKMLVSHSSNDVNESDECGNRPLHAAAAGMNPSAIKTLIEFEADPTLRNDKGQTPLDCLEVTRQSTSDLKKTFSIAFINPVEVNAFVESALSLMADKVRSQLIDGWLSPRMTHMLLITAEIACGTIKDCDCGQFTKFQPLPLLDCCWITFFQYIPTEVFHRNPQGLYKSFCDGWAIVWGAIESLLRKRQAPTISQVIKEIYESGADQRKWNHFVEKGGIIEFALDALFDTTRNLLVLGDDGWEYCEFQDEIEAQPATSYSA